MTLKFSRVLILAVTLAGASLAAGVAGAQQATGGIAGVVTDSTHEVLPGAAVRLQPGNLVTASDASGHFHFLGVAPGSYTLSIAYVGFRPASVAAQVQAGAVAQLTPVLQLSSVTQEVVVTAPRPYGEAAAINTQRTSDNIIDALPESVITSLPNANVADAVGRLPGVTLERDEGEGKYVQIRGTEPRLSNTTVDGVELQAPESGIRQVKLDVIPADLMGSVELYKTLAADQPGDAIGGSVNLVTKTAGSRPTLSFYSSGGLTPIDNNRYAGEIGGSAGRRFGVKKDWGAIVSGSFDGNGRGIDDVEPAAAANATASQPVWANADFRQYLYNRTRYGFGGSVDHILGPNSNIYLRGLMADFVDGGVRTVYNVDAQGNGPALGAEQRIGNYLVSSLILGGHQQAADSGTTVDWEISAARSRMLYPQFDNTGGFTYTGPASQCASAPTANPDLPQFAPVCFQEAYDLSHWSLSQEKLGGYGQSAKLDWAGRLDMSQFFDLGGHPDTLKFGVASDHVHQFDDSWQVDYSVANDPATGQPFAIPATLFVDPGAYNANYYNGAYTAGPFISYSAIANYITAHAGLFTRSSSQGQDSNNYGLNEFIPAGYVMDTYDAGRVRVVAGLRVEHTSVHTLSPDTNNALTIPGTFAYTDFLPSASLQYTLDSSSDLRWVYGRGISRPVPSDLTAAVSEDLSVNPNTANIGNPTLRPEHGNDFDLLYERYFTPLGAIRGGFFYKNLADPIVSIQTNPTSGPYAGFRVTQPANGGSAYIAGLELEFEQQFTYLPSVLRGVGLSGNYSFTTAQAKNVNPGNRSDSPRLLRQAPMTWNLSPTFDLGRLSARLGFAYNGANIYQYNYVDGAPGGIAGPSGDVYEYTHFQVDAQASFRLTPGLQFTISGLNLNNAVFGFYQGSPEFPIQREFYHPTYSVGLRWTLGE